MKESITATLQVRTYLHTNGKKYKQHRIHVPNHIIERLHLTDEKDVTVIIFGKDEH